MKRARGGRAVEDKELVGDVLVEVPLLKVMILRKGLKIRALSRKGDNTAVKMEIFEGFANARWTDEERTILLNYYLGPESDEFKGLKMNALHANKKVRVSIHFCDISLL